MVGEVDHKIWIDAGESDASRMELLEFVETLRHGDWPHLMKLWQKNICHSLECCNMSKGIFETKRYHEPL
jgi:hypothetical protein